MTTIQFHDRSPHGILVRNTVPAARAVVTVGFMLVAAFVPGLEADRGLLVTMVGVLGMASVASNVIGRRLDLDTAAQLDAIVDAVLLVGVAWVAPGAWRAVVLIAAVALALHASRLRRGAFALLVVFCLTGLALTGVGHDGTWDLDIALLAVMMGPVFVGASKYQEELKVRNGQLSMLADSVGAIVWETGADGRISAVHGPIERLGLSAEELIGHSPSDLPLTEVPGLAFGDGAANEMNCYVSLPGVDSMYFSRVAGDANTGRRSSGAFFDVTALVRAQERERFWADHDAKTGALSRDGFVRRVETAVIDATEPMVLGVVRMQGLRQVGDMFGRAASEAAMTIQLERIRTLVDDDTVIGRVSDDEVVVLARTATHGDPSRLAREFKARLNRPVVVDGTQLDTGVEIRSIDVPADSTDVEALLRLADWSFRADSQAQVLDPSERDRFDPLLLQERLESVVEVWYQPIVEPKAGQIRGIEALARYRHAGELVPTTRLLEVVEALGLMDRLDRHVAAVAIADCARLRQLCFDINVSINASQNALGRDDYATHIAHQCELNELHPSHLVFEVSERDLAANVDDVISTLNALSAMGSLISLDDFGTGHSSLIQLRDMPIDEIKIDRQFVMELASSTTDGIIVDSVVRLAREIGARVVVEGVEDVVTNGRVVSVGADLIQGYLFGAAQPLSKVIELENLVACPSV